MIFKTNNLWDTLVQQETSKPYFKDLMNFLDIQYSIYNIFPEKENVFRAFSLTDFTDVRVVILGQDPYYKMHQANGLCFSVDNDINIPPSLKNIFKEIKADIGVEHTSGDLSYLANSGVLLLNTVLTVREDMPNSHTNIGWETFTDCVISLLNKSENPIVFLLWGNNAISKKQLITNKNHYILQAPHPSPLSSYRGFFGCKHFSKTNAILKSNNQKEIQW